MTETKAKSKPVKTAVKKPVVHKAVAKPIVHKAVAAGKYIEAMGKRKTAAARSFWALINPKRRLNI
jgi:hypothetical protein